MDSPRGRIYQMAQVAAGDPVSETYRKHIDLCLACRACETACPSGVPYGRLVEDARAEIESKTKRGWLVRQARAFLFNRLLPSPSLLTAAGALLYLYQASGFQKLVRAIGLPRVLGSAGEREALLPDAEIPFFFREYGKTFPASFPASGEKKTRVAFLAGCVAGISFARLNEATVRVLQACGCEVVIPAAQTCCGALQNHAGVRETARRLARRNIDAFASADVIVTNAAGCGSTLKEYGELMAEDPAYAEQARGFAAKVKDVTEFLAEIGLNPEMKPVNAVVTYQDSCHLSHGQKIRNAPRQLLRAIPGLEFREMPLADSCCGSAGIYNVLHTDMSMRILEKKMASVNAVKPAIIATANPGCMLQLRAGVRKWGQPDVRVAHVIELLDEAYRKSLRNANVKGSS
jgi:glycolate oxidase iron-sulfur subunit